ncbi:ABC-F family ATP-binding cassette domain-containing protein [bacterium]|nr:ABC-F family ATP-binding cassette domain-containing protein [bacterium]
MIHLQNIYLQFGHKEIFQDMSWHIKKGERIAIVGRNGAGKTTLFRVLNSEQDIDKGEIKKTGSSKIGYLPQEQVAFEDKKALDILLYSNKEWVDCYENIKKLEKNLNDEKKIEQYSQLVDKFEHLGGFKREIEAKKILSGFGILESDFNKPINEFSGGWRMRIYLAKLLLDQPEILLLDEPTNHLDLPALMWLEYYLQSFPNTLLFISHDKEFINRISTHVAELDNKNVQIYPGNYDSYKTQKAAQEELLEKTAEKQQEQIEHLSSFIDRFKAKATKAAQAQSRQKQLDKIKSELITLPQKKEVFKFRLPEGIKSGREVVNVNSVSKNYGELSIFSDASFIIERGERIAIVGANGIGKTTMLKMIIGATDFIGDIKIGHQVDISYFGQHQIDELNINNEIIQEIESNASMEDIPKIRTILGSFLFKKDDVYQKISTLSGGEKSRVALVKMLLQKANFLLLDEPTNHLDLESKEILLEALKNYGGTVLFVSHDRYFIKELATSIIAIENRKTEKYIGGYDYYLSKITPVDEKKNSIQSTTTNKSQKREEAEKRNELSKILRPLKDRFSKIELEIDRLEGLKKNIVNIISDPDFYQKNSSEKITQTNLELKSIENSLEKLNEEWEELYIQIDEIKQQN